MVKSYKRNQYELDLKAVCLYCAIFTVEVIERSEKGAEVIERSEGAENFERSVFVAAPYTRPVGKIGHVRESVRPSVCLSVTRITFHPVNRFGQIFFI